MKTVRSLLMVLALGLLSVAVAGLGDPQATLLEDLSDYAPVASDDGFTAADDFHFRFDSAAGVATAVSGEGRLSDANVRFVGALLAAAAGYGSDLAAPIADFFRTRAEDLNGAGPVPIQVVDYDLTATVTGDSPGMLEFYFEPRRVAQALFPPAAHTLGAADADYVIRVFSDFQCPFCAGFAENAMPMVEAELLTRDDVRFELHHFPLRSIHPNANIASEASECVAAEAGEEGFWTFHDALFEQQARWANLPDPVATFQAMAEELALPHGNLATCLRSGHYTDDVQDAYRAASEGLLLTGTPTVFLNGLKVGDYAELGNYLRLMRLSDALAVADAVEQPGETQEAGEDTPVEEPATEPDGESGGASSGEPGEAPAGDTSAP